MEDLEHWGEDGGYMRRRINGTLKLQHVVIAERVLGKPLPKGACVHHVNEDGTDNRNCNLVICPDQTYHSLLHRRMKARAACGNADWQRCWYCSVYDAPENLGPPNKHVYHRKCKALWTRQARAKKREAAYVEN